MEFHSPVIFSGLVRIDHRIVGGCHRTENTGCTGRVFRHFFHLLAVEIALRVTHDRGKVAIEVVTEYPFYLCKTLCMSDFAHILIIQLVQKLFFGLLYGVMVYLHLFGKELL